MTDTLETLRLALQDHIERKRNHEAHARYHAEKARLLAAEIEKRLWEMEHGLAA